MSLGYCAEALLFYSSLMRIHGKLVLSLFLFVFFLNRLPSASASEVSQETPIQKLRFLLVQYQRLENGYDPQAIMNKWQGQVLNQSEQTNSRPFSNTSPYGNGTRSYPESMYRRPPQTSLPLETSVQPAVPRQPSSSVIAPSYYPPYEQFGSQPSPSNPPYQQPPAYGPGYPYQQPYPVYPSQMYAPAPFPPQMTPQMPYQQPIPPRSCFCA